jgi:hypothetical protein
VKPSNAAARHERDGSIVGPLLAFGLWYSTKYACVHNRRLTFLAFGAGRGISGKGRLHIATARVPMLWSTAAAVPSAAIMRTTSRSGPAPKARSKPRVLKITGLGIAQELITLACSRSWMRDSGATKRAGISLEQPRRRIDQQPVPFFWRSDYSLENGFPGQR